ncbi:MAG: hypothetical protein KatS3mg064_0958 [Tepidiforma sp.]|nr:urease accessory protein UreD [Tepidiforma sp.]GIW17801.1 MAG: hypothetical protein KatS3mg064_0958 [Tepidiforma sp.]
MTSRARLVLAAGSPARLAEAYAETPQRWTPGPAETGWRTVYHQLLGDGCFPADRLLTSVTVSGGARAVVRAVAATPLRAGAASVAAARLRVRAGSALVYVPGALIPHAGARHLSGLDARVEPGGCLAVVQAWAPGRVAHEQGRFDHLRTRTRLAVGSSLLLWEDVTIRASDWPAGDPVAVTIYAIGEWAPACPGWWKSALEPLPYAAANPLGSGAIVRALFPSLGAAAAFVEGSVEAMRKSLDMKICSSPGKLPETLPKAD